ncbi:hypothetical protein [Isoptericola jiangsuensis]|uniref:hypothetical protein n=1 Tax=Isoptericola jiangsuensis TaxID=548579 RepID=UPI001145F321|nr:hypothetical protein [Isoptericola jiangsuensis]
MLNLLGAVDAEAHGTFVVAGSNYWIDLSVRTDGPRVDEIQFRVAVTNPVSVVDILDGLLAQISSHFNGSLTDAAGRELTEPDVTSSIRADFVRGRARFVSVFGEVDIPVSADDVFASLKERDISGPT